MCIRVALFSADFKSVASVERKREITETAKTGELEEIAVPAETTEIAVPAETREIAETTETREVQEICAEERRDTCYACAVKSQCNCFSATGIKSASS